MLLGLWHATNELNALRKLILLVNNNKTKNPLESGGKALTGVMLIKVFAVKAAEAWSFFKKAQNFPEFKAKYLSHEVSPDLIRAKDWLGNYFGKSNILQKVRDKLGAHYDYASVSKAATSLKKLDSYIFLPEHQGNALYWVAEELQLRALKELGDVGEEFASVYKRLVDDVGEVAAHITAMTQFVSIVAIEEAGISRNFRLSLTHKVRARLSQFVDIPFFVDFADDLK
jgi:hypothetical protein